MTTQTKLPGRTSAQVPRGTSPAAAAQAARASTENVKAPSAQKGKGKKGGKSKKADAGDYDAGDYDAGGFGGSGGDDDTTRTIPGFGKLLPGEDENEALEGGPRLVQKGERSDGKYQDSIGRWRDGNNKGRCIPPPGPEPGADPVMAAAQKEVLGVYKPSTLESVIDPDTGKAKMPEGKGNLIDKFRAVFREDKHPDLPLDDASKREQGARDKYMQESQRIAEAILVGGRPRTSSGQFVSRVTITTHGAVQLRGKGGQIREVPRGPYQAGDTGRVSHNIEPPITREVGQLREVVDARLERYGSSLFQDRAKLSPRRLAAMRIAFALDRQERGWPVPDWGLVL